MDVTVFRCGHPRTPGNSLGNGANAAPICKICAKARRAKQPKKKKKRPDRCGRGHEYTPENTLLTASGNRNCKICWSLKRKAMRIEKPKKAAKTQRTRCPAGHELTGWNAQRVGNRICCRTCRNVNQTARQRAKRLGLSYEYKIKLFGTTPEEKIAIYRQPPDENGCRLWTGPMTKKIGGRPHLQTRTFEGGKAVNGCAFSLARVWEEGSGRKLPPRHVVVMTCPGGNRCTTYEHMKVEPWKEWIREDENMKRGVAELRLRRGRDRERYVEAVQRHESGIRGRLQKKFGSVITSHIEDIMQHVRVSAFLAWARDRTEILNVRSFLLTTAIRRATDVLRHLKSRRTTSLEEMMEENEFDGAVEWSQFKDEDKNDPAIFWELVEEEEMQRAEFSKRLRLVPPKARALLRLQHTYGLSQRELAQAANISENTVEQHLGKARRRIRAGQEPDGA